MEYLWHAGVRFLQQSLHTKEPQIDEHLLQRDWQSELPFLAWKPTGALVCGFGSDGRAGYLCKDGTYVAFDDPRLGQYREVAEIKWRKQLAEMAKTAEECHDHIVDPENDEPLSRDILRARPEMAAWLNGDNPNYCPSIAERFIILPAFLDRRRRLSERSLMAAAAKCVTWLDVDGSPRQSAASQSINTSTVQPLEDSESTSMSKTPEPLQPCKAFISYSWDDDDHKAWTKDFATRLRQHGVDVTLDQWALIPGDQLPKFMETAIRENSYVVIVCTPNYKLKSDQRKGGVGYEGDIMTAEVRSDRNDRKFIPVLREGSWDTAMPSWLKGKYSINLSGSPYSEEQYNDLITTLHNYREQAPPIGKPPHFKTIREKATTLKKEHVNAAFQAIKIEGVLADEVGRPANDGSRGSALYSVPFKLNCTPSREWADLFIQTWDHPPQYTTSHRPGIARVYADRVILTRTTIEEVKDVHRDTLNLVVGTVNKQIEELSRRRRATEEAEQLRESQRRENIQRVAEDIKFE